MCFWKNCLKVFGEETDDLEQPLKFWEGSDTCSQVGLHHKNHDEQDTKSLDQSLRQKHHRTVPYASEMPQLPENPRKQDKCAPRASAWSELNTKLSLYIIADSVFFKRLYLHTQQIVAMRLIKTFMYNKLDNSLFFTQQNLKNNCFFFK